MRWLIVWKFVSRPPSQRWLTYGMPAALGDLLDGVARLLLRADEEDRAAAAGELGGEVLRLARAAAASAAGR